MDEFQFTHPGRGATLYHHWLRRVDHVSIHAPREGCDDAPIPKSIRCWVSIHAPREGCDPQRLHRKDRTNQFQFTHPGRGATGRIRRRPSTRSVSIHAPREGCDGQGLDVVAVVEVSIHAPREGCDVPHEERANTRTRFQFTHPGRGATTAV